jgi:glycosyltransferase involved in cell wall biosynthesis
MPSKPRILFLQFTNPAGYPPLEHASRILAAQGWDVRFLGTGAYGADALCFPEHPAILVQRLPTFSLRIVQRLAYASYLAWALAVCLTWRPRWIYASEPVVALPALLARRLVRCHVAYHEHDSPSPVRPITPLQRLFRWARGRLARRAEICILPQQQRLSAFVGETGRTGPTLCVWNTPRQDEIAPPRQQSAPPDRPLRIYYHGSLNDQRLPLSVLDGLVLAGANATLTIVGYETVGSPGYMQRFMGHAARLGIADRVLFRGPLNRARMLHEAAQADVGLAFMPIGSDDINMRHMVGASNKPFDYLAVGLMLLVSDLPEWRDTYVAPGFARACDPVDLDSLANAFAWCVANPDEVRAMGERGRQMIEREWNFETQFAPLAACIAPGCTHK